MNDEFGNRRHDSRSRVSRSSFIIHHFPWGRLAAMLAMLAVILLLMARLQDPDVARAIGRLFAPQGQPAANPTQTPQDNQEKPEKQAKGAAPAQPEAARRATLKVAPPPRPAVPAPQPKPAPELPLGPTDEDEEEAAEAREEFQAVTDGTIGIPLQEMFAYQRVVQWVINQPASLMEKRAKAHVTFNDLMLSPDEHRGTLVELNLRARIIRKYDAPEVFDVPLYEIWGSSWESGAWPYDAMVVDLPPGLKAAPRVNLNLRIVGYFFKLQGYYPGKAKPGSRPEQAPLLIGRVVWAEPAPPEDASGVWPWAWVLLGIFLMLLAVRLGFLVFGRRRKRGMIVTGARGPGAMPIDQWFDHAAAGDFPEEEPLDDGSEPTPK